MGGGEISIEVGDEREVQGGYARGSGMRGPVGPQRNAGAGNRTGPIGQSPMGLMASCSSSYTTALDVVR